MTAEEATETESEEAGESGGMSERTAKAVLVVVACGALWGLVAAFPWIAYVVVGVLGCLGWQKVRGWAGRRGSAEEDAEPEELDVVEALQHLGQKGDSVLLTQLQKRLGAADTKAVKALLDGAGVRWRDGVRTPAGNGPGVHQEDIPAPPPREETPSESGCSCSSEPTTPTPTTGPTVAAIGLAGVVVKDGSEVSRSHRV